jgi:hypothetical protein
MPAWRYFPLEKYEKFKLAWGVDREILCPSWLPGDVRIPVLSAAAL